MFALDGGVFALGGGGGVLTLDGCPCAIGSGNVFVLGNLNLFAFDGHVFALDKDNASGFGRGGVAALGGGGVFVLGGGMIGLAGAEEGLTDDLPSFECVPRRYMFIEKRPSEWVARLESLALLERAYPDSVREIAARIRSAVIRTKQALKYLMVSHSQSRFC